MWNTIVRVLHLRGLRRKVTFFRVNYLLSGAKEKYFEKKRMLLSRLEGIEIGEGSRIVGPLEISGRLKIGKNCWIGKNLCVNGNGSVTIGDNCDIAPEVTFQTGGHEVGSTDRRAGKGLIFHQFVGNGVWIGGRATILNNVSIGNGAVIAGCACVTKDIPANTMVGGVPAKIIRDLSDENDSLD